MALGTDYAQQDCSLARTLELVGERWTLLIVRDAFFGVRRFSDFERHLEISKAVLAQRLAALVEAGVLARTPRAPGSGHDDYLLTERGTALWPAVHALTQWGEANASPAGPRRIFAHVACGTDLEASGRCPGCGAVPPAGELEMRPGPGARRTGRTDAVSVALREPCRLLEPLERKGPAAQET